MSKAPLPPPAVDPARPPTAPWVWPAVVAVALSPFVLTAFGLVAVALGRPARPPAPPVVSELPVEAVAVAPAPAAPAPEPEPVEPGEARPPIPGWQPPAEELVAAEPEPVPVATVKGPKCERFGTAINFVRSPTLACDRAARDQKLALILHVAGHFEDPGFT